MFEPSFVVDNLYARADILVPVKDKWDIIEVKSSTSVKPEHIHDVSFQKYVYEKAGLKIRNCYLMHLNNEYVRKGDIDVKKLFVKEDITADVEGVSEGIIERISEMFDIINDVNCPDIPIHEGCFKPYNCPVEEECWGFLPENSVFELYRGGKKCFELLDNGIHHLKDIPSSCKLNDKQKIQCSCGKTGKIHIDRKEIKKFLDKLKYPLYFMDFETYNTAVPLYDGLKPYSQICFQFSLHVQNDKIEHYEFLASNGDPRKEFIASLKEVLGSEGSIIVYNESFEKKRLEELGELFPEYSDWVKSVNKRIVDLIVPFRNFGYYNLKQKGKCGLKQVLPAITSKGYDELLINQGGDASQQYFYAVHGGASEAEIKKIRKALLEYCKLDTEGMVWIVDELRGIVE